MFLLHLPQLLCLGYNQSGISKDFSLPYLQFSKSFHSGSTSLIFSHVISCLKVQLDCQRYVRSLKVQLGLQLLQSTSFPCLQLNIQNVLIWKVFFTIFPFYRILNTEILRDAPFDSFSKHIIQVKFCQQDQPSWQSTTQSGFLKEILQWVHSCHHPYLER